MAKAVDPLASFTAKYVIDPATGCWQWTGAKSGGGYGALRIRGQYVIAHRFSYEHHVGPIPTGLHVDHLCRNRGCVNPDHLEPVTVRENLLRGNTIQAWNAAKTHCKHGHEFTPENTKRDGRGCRRCRTCLREASAARSKRRHAA